MDDRFDGKKASFKTKMKLKPKLSGILDDQVARLFDGINYDSDGDGVSNVMERAFGGDSLVNEHNSILTRAIPKKDVSRCIICNRFTDESNTRDDEIQYLVETSRDLRAW